MSAVGTDASPALREPAASDDVGVAAITADDRTAAGRAPERQKGRAPASRKPSRRTARRAKRKEGRRGRWIARLVSLVALVAVGVFGWRWIESSGLLEERRVERTAITVPANRPAELGGGGTVDDADWTEVMLPDEVSGAITALPEGGVRIDGEARVPLDPDALAGLGARARIALVMRGVGETAGELAVTCDIGGSGCGRTRFPVAREATERLLDIDVAPGAASLVLDPSIGGETVPVELLAIRARAL